MSELDKIKNRIQNRRNSSQEVEIVDVDVVSVQKKYSKPSKLYKISMFVLVILIKL